MFSVFEGTNKRNLSTSAAEAETKYKEGEVLKKKRIRDGLSRQASEKKVEHFINSIVLKQGKH